MLNPQIKKCLVGSPTKLAQSLHDSYGVSDCRLGQGVLLLLLRKEKLGLVIFLLTV